MKKIIISITALCSALTFAIENTIPSHRLEGDLGLAFQVTKKDDKKLDAWQRYTKLGVTYMPEWNHEINDKVGLTFGPKANFGVETNITRQKESSDENLYGLKGSLGGELDIDFKLPQGEVIYLGFDGNLGGIGYIESWKVKEHGFTSDLGVAVGGKINDKIKLGLRLGYEFEGTWEKTEKKETTETTPKATKESTKENPMKSAHNMTIGLRFGYLLGK